MILWSTGQSPLDVDLPLFSSLNHFSFIEQTGTTIGLLSLHPSQSLILLPMIINLLQFQQIVLPRLNNRYKLFRPHHGCRSADDHPRELNINLLGRMHQNDLTLKCLLSIKQTKKSLKKS